MEACYPAQIVVVGVEILGRLALGPLDLCLFQLRSDRSDDAPGHLLLQIKDVLQCRLETVRPDMRPVAASMSCPVMRTRFAALRTLPSST